MATFNPTTGQIDGSISPALFFKADTLALTDGTAVASLTDTANGNAWAQATGTKQPLFKTGIFGAKPSIRFDGVDDILANTAGAATNRSTVIVCFKPTTTVTTATAQQMLFGWVTSGVGQALGISLGSVSGTLTNELVTTNYVQGNYSAWTQSGGTLPSTAPHIVTARWNAGTTRYDIFHDGGANLTSQVVGTPSQASSAAAQLGMTNQNTVPFAGDIGVVLSYATVLSDAQKAAVHSYLKDVWGATAADYDSGWAGGGATSWGKGFFAL